jgi:hypothetical protein
MSAKKQVDERFCYCCGIPLDFSEYITQNYHLNHDFLTKLWKHSLIEFYCCECFKEYHLAQKGIFKCCGASKQKNKNENHIQKKEYE